MKLILIRAALLLMPAFILSASLADAQNATGNKRLYCTKKMQINGQNKLDIGRDDFEFDANNKIIRSQTPPRETHEILDILPTSIEGDARFLRYNNLAFREENKANGLFVPAISIRRYSTLGQNAYYPNIHLSETTLMFDMDIASDSASPNNDYGIESAYLVVGADHMIALNTQVRAVPAGGVNANQQITLNKHISAELPAYDFEYMYNQPTALILVNKDRAQVAALHYRAISIDDHINAANQSLNSVVGKTIFKDINQSPFYEDVQNGLRCHGASN